MSNVARICVYFSKGRRFSDVLRAVREQERHAHICAMIPARYPLSAQERAMADEVVETELARYSLRRPRACARLVRQIRDGHYDGFVILFASPKLRILSALAGTRRRMYCTMDGRLVAIHASIAGIIAGTVARNLWGRVVYMGIWLTVHMLPVRHRG